MKLFQGVRAIISFTRRRGLLWSLSMLGLSLNLQAQTLEPAEKIFLQDMPIVLSVSRLAQRLDETPGAVTVIDRATIAQSGARDVIDLLRMVPGYQVSAAFQSSAPTASYHGIVGPYSNRLELLVDGRSVYSTYLIGSIGPGLQTMALEDIDHIEVMRGSNAASYGARAFLGAINIVTRSTTETLGQQVALTQGGNGIHDGLARIGWKSELASYRLTLDQRRDDGLAGALGSNQVARVNFRSDVQLASGGALQVRAGQTTIDTVKEDGNSPRLVRPTSLSTSYVQVDGLSSMSSERDLTWQFSQTEEDYVDQVAYPPFMLTLSGHARNVSLSVQETYRPNLLWRTVFGLEYRHEQLTSLGMFNTNDVLSTEFLRAFANVEWRFAPAFVANVGAMFEHSSRAGDRLSPRAMVNWHLAPGQTLRVGVSQAYRPPSTFENQAQVQYGTPLSPKILNSTQGTGLVRPESLRSYELGYLARYEPAGLDLDVRAFVERVGGYIRLKAVPAPRYYSNDENFVIKGLEYQTRWHPWSGTVLSWGQTYTTNSASLGALPSGWQGYNTSKLAPRLLNQLSLSQDLGQGLQLTLMHVRSTAVVAQNASVVEGRAWQRSDVRLAKALRLGQHRAELALVVQNLGKPYVDYDLPLTFRRQAFVSLKLDL